MSNLRLILTSKVWVFIQVQLVMIASAPSLRKRQRGRMLIKKAHFTAVLTWVSAQSGGRGRGEKEVRTGNVSRRKMVIRLVAITVEVRCIAATWICTKSFWFLRPTDELLSFRSGASELGSSTQEAKISSLCCCQPLSVDKGVLTSVFRITI